MYIKSIPSGSEVKILKTVEHHISFNLTTTGRVAIMYQTRTSKDRRNGKVRHINITPRAGYFGFRTRTDADQFCRAVSSKYGAICQVRSPKRLSGYEYEAKVQNFASGDTTLEVLAQTMAERQDARELNPPEPEPTSSNCGYTNVVIRIQTIEPYFEEMLDEFVHEIQDVTVRVPLNDRGQLTKDSINEAIEQHYPGWQRYVMSEAEREAIEAEAYADYLDSREEIRQSLAPSL
ncbi:hypothetical protein Pse7367_0874 [Thalassoporum mexicanum PCC 7367]|uniref:hypothetical protein n=1 Tax=Thalassoporum mexicanum TaxID=3457544 RepID=UPI00029FBDCB|nr:hypothetical protein [Pseudanabaena sp. PCC 7367]AFY69174.1 hypothetical protein Pse7367_0874 [Pseudanabaena sp. PCC 7367]